MTVQAFSRLDALIRKQPTGIGGTSLTLTWTTTVNAGVAIFGTTEKTTLEDYKKVFDINYFSLISMIGHALPHMKKVEPSGGKIILVSSGAATGGVAGWGAYSSVKGPPTIP